MKVSKLKIGNLYKIQYPVHGNIERITSNHWGVTGWLEHPVEIMRLHKWGTFSSDHGNVVNESGYIVYLGSESENWKFHGIKKHHYFLYDGKRIIVDNYCMKMLKEVENGTL